MRQRQNYLSGVNSFGVRTSRIVLQVLLKEDVPYRFAGRGYLLPNGFLRGQRRRNSNGMEALTSGRSAASNQTAAEEQSLQAKQITPRAADSF